MRLIETVCSWWASVLEFLLVLIPTQRTSSVRAFYTQAVTRSAVWWDSNPTSKLRQVELSTSDVWIFEIFDRIEQLITVGFDPKPMKLFEIFEYLPSPSYLCTYLTMVHKEYNGLSTTQTTHDTNRVALNCWNYLTSSYQWWLLSVAKTTWFKISNNVPTTRGLGSIVE